MSMIHVTEADGIVRIALDRPKARNALSLQGWYDLTEALGTVSPESHAVVLCSHNPGIFCAGADLRDLPRLAEHPEERPVFREAWRNAVEALAELPMPTLALIEGGCFGAAVGLMLAADFRIATPAACFSLPPAKLGIGYPAQDLARLTAQVGHGQASRLMFTAETIDAAEALRIGLIETVVANPSAMLSMVAANDSGALRLLKRLMADPVAPDADTAFDAMFGGAAFVLALAAFWDRQRTG